LSAGKPGIAGTNPQANKPPAAISAVWARANIVLSARAERAAELGVIICILSDLTSGNAVYLQALLNHSCNVRLIDFIINKGFSLQSCNPAVPLPTVHPGSTFELRQGKQADGGRVFARSELTLHNAKYSRWYLCNWTTPHQVPNRGCPLLII
jgi:hypothetical protein